MGYFGRGFVISARSKTIWQNGVQLRDAWRHFGLADDVARYQELPDVLEVLVKQSELAAPPGIAKFLQAGSAAWLDKKTTEKRLKELLLDELFNGQLIATGYRQFPTTSPGPIMIDAEAFDDAKINWNDDIVQVHGKAYGRVRITDDKESHIVKIRANWVSIDES